MACFLRCASSKPDPLADTLLLAGVAVSHTSSHSRHNSSHSSVSAPARLQRRLHKDWTLPATCSDVACALPHLLQTQPLRQQAHPLPVVHTPEHPTARALCHHPHTTQRSHVQSDLAPPNKGPARLLLGSNHQHGSSSSSSSVTATVNGRPRRHNSIQGELLAWIRSNYSRASQMSSTPWN